MTTINFEGFDAFKAWWNKSDQDEKLEMLMRFGIDEVPEKLDPEVRRQIGYVLVAKNAGDLRIYLRYPHFDKGYMAWAEGDPKAIGAFNAMVQFDHDDENGPFFPVSHHVLHQVGNRGIGDRPPEVSGWEYWVDKYDPEICDMVRNNVKYLSQRFGVEMGIKIS